MNFKVKKAYYRLFSVLLSLVMIVISVPISAFAELSSDDATEASESVQSENLGKIESGEISLPINPAEMTAVTDDVITDGVYAFRNVNNPNMWLDTGFSSPLPDSYMQQYAYPTAPNATNAFYKGGLFKIKCMSTANPHYVIRLMTNNELIFRPNKSTSYVHSLKVSPTDTAVPSASRYLLQKTDAGYIIKLVGSPYCIATPQSNVSGEGTVASRLTYLSPTEAQTNTRAQWQLYKYEGSQRSEIALSVSPDEMVPNESTTVSGYLSSTVIGFNGPIEYSVSETDESITNKATVNSTSGELTANAVGEIKLWVKSGSFRNYKIIKIAENVSGTYFFNNVEYPNKYVQIDNNNDMLGEEIIELHNFLGYNYQCWTVDYISNGYYKIISEYSNLELTAPTGYGNDVVTQTSPSSANTHLWKFIKQSDETYEISPKSNSNCFLAAGDESSAADQDLEIRSAQSDGRDEWNLVFAYDASLIAFYERYDRSSYFPDIAQSLSGIGYDYVYYNNGEESFFANKTDIIDYMSHSKITLIRTHGHKLYIELTEEVLTTSDIISLPEGAFTYSKLIIYGACATGKGGADADNLVNATYSRGANTVIGFTKSPRAEEINMWCVSFFESLSSGSNIREACDDAREYIYDNWYDPYDSYYAINTDTPHIAGNAYAVFD